MPRTLGASLVRISFQLQIGRYNNYICRSLAGNMPLTDDAEEEDIGDADFEAEAAGEWE